MFRAISEMAVAISVASVREKPRWSASARPSARAGSMSESAAIGTRISVSIAAPRPVVEQGKPFFEVESGAEWLEVHVELHHRDRDVRADADDHRLGAAQLRRQRD